MIIGGLLFGSALNIILNYLIANLFGFSIQMIILSQIILLALSFILFIYQKGKLIESNAKLRLSLISVALVSLFIFTPLFVSHMLNIENGNYYTGGFAYGDLAFHTTLINSFVYGNNFPPQNPVFSGSKLSYPPAIDFLSSMFMLTGSTIQQALYIPGIVYAVAITLIVFIFAYQLTGRLFPAFLTPILLIFNGGIGFYYFVLDMQAEGKNIFIALTTMTKEYAHLMDYNIRFSNIVADYLLPQRAFLMGFPLGILILILIFNYFKHKENGNLILAGILTGLLPLIHPHSLIAIIMVSFFLLISNLNMKNILNFLKYYLPSFLVFAIIPLSWIFSSQVSNQSFLRIQFFWMAGNDNPILFWLKNLGLVAPLIFVSLIMAPRKLVLSYVPFASVFVITNILIFQPHDYDNMKIMLYWFLASVILISYLLHVMWQRRSLISRTLFYLSLFFLTITGVLSILRESYTIFQMYDREGLNLAYQVRQITSPGDVILTSDQHNNPITSFAGRSIVMGYRGWLWTWGYDYKERERDVLDIYQGSPNAKELINKYNISLIIIGPTERSQFLANESYFNSNFHLLLRTNNYKVYDAKNI